MWFSNYLTNRFQYVSLGTFNSKMLPILCGVPQGSILGPLLFLLYINDMPNCTNFFTLLFADDTTLQLTSNNTDTLFQLANTELTKVNDWFSRNALTLNVKKTKYILFHTPRMAIDLPLPTLKINNSKIERIHSNDTGDGSFKFVGMHLDEHLSWSKHVDNLVKKLNFACFTISRIKNILPLCIRRTLYMTLFQSHLEYGILAYGAISKKQANAIFMIQKRCIRNVAGSQYNAHTDPLFKELKILKFHDLFEFSCNKFMFKFTNNLLPNSFCNMFQTLSMENRTNGYITSLVRKKCLESFPSSFLPKVWNKNSLLLKQTNSFTTFKMCLINEYLDSYDL